MYPRAINSNKTLLSGLQISCCKKSGIMASSIIFYERTPKFVRLDQ
jgi:hypothetical protein